MRALVMIEEQLLQHKEVTRVTFEEIYQNFQQAMRQAMLNYILRCPQERARLQIELLPRQILSSAERIGREGGFSVRQYGAWHKYVCEGRQLCRVNLVGMSVIHSALLNWFEDFSHLLLCEHEAFKKTAILGFTFSIEHYIRLQTVNLEHTVSILRNIWHRGACLIIKKQKYLKSHADRQKIWCFKGFKLNKRVRKMFVHGAWNAQERADERERASLEYMLRIVNQPMSDKERSHAAESIYLKMVEYYCSQQILQSDPEASSDGLVTDFYASRSFQDLIDIRGTFAGDAEWRAYAKEKKSRVLRNVSTLLILQLRKVLENSLQSLQDFFLSYPLLKGILKQGEESAKKFSTSTVVGTERSIQLAPESSPRKQNKPAKLPEEEKSLLQLVPPLAELEFKKPAFFEHGEKCFPLLSLQMVTPRRRSASPKSVRLRSAQRSAQRSATQRNATQRRGFTTLNAP